VGFYVLFGAVWLVSAIVWRPVMGRVSHSGRERLGAAVVLGFVTTIVVWFVLMAIFAGWTND
jgi:hypothetical protein